MTGLTEGTAYNITIRSNNGTIGQDTGLPAELVNVNTPTSKIATNQMITKPSIVCTLMRSIPILLKQHYVHLLS